MAAKALQKVPNWDFPEDAMRVANLLGYYEPNAAIVDLYYKGWSIRQIAKAFDKQPMTIHVKLKKLGVQMRPQGGYHRS